MDPRISLLVCSRIEGNENHGLKNLLDDLSAKSSNKDNFEILIKFDEDDIAADPSWRALLSDYDLNIKKIITPRGKGYADVHKGYTQLMPYVAESSNIIGAVADDFRVITEGWDQILINTAAAREYFIIHSHKPNENVNIDNLIDTIHDESSFWSKKVIYACQCQWWVYATDAWTTALEYYLSKHCVKLALLTHATLFQRHFNNKIDTYENKERWAVRDTAFKFTQSKFFKDMVRLQAQNITLQFRNQAATSKRRGIYEQVH